MFHVYLFFFFSSRRRHTRFKCDWSSDVCSSDLESREKGAKGLKGLVRETAPDFFGPRDFVLRREHCSRRGAVKSTKGAAAPQGDAGLKPGATKAQAAICVGPRSRTHSQEWLCHEPQKQKGPEGK